MTSAPLPVVDDPDTSGFWTAARRGEIAVCRCAQCGELVQLPRGICHRCYSTDIGWEAVTPRARLVAWTVAEHQVHPAFPVPYTVVLVELQDVPQVRLAGYLPGRPALAAGMPMRAVLRDAAPGVSLVDWAPEAADAI